MLPFIKLEKIDLSFNIIKYIELETLMNLNKNAYKKITFLFYFNRDIYDCFDIFGNKTILQ